MSNGSQGVAGLGRVLVCIYARAESGALL